MAGSEGCVLVLLSVQDEKEAQHQMKRWEEEEKNRRCREWDIERKKKELEEIMQTNCPIPSCRGNFHMVHANDTECFRKTCLVCNEYFCGYCEAFGGTSREVYNHMQKCSSNPWNWSREVQVSYLGTRMEFVARGECSCCGQLLFREPQSYLYMPTHTAADLVRRLAVQRKVLRWWNTIFDVAYADRHAKVVSNTLYADLSTVLHNSALLRRAKPDEGEAVSHPNDRVVQLAELPAEMVRVELLKIPDYRADWCTGSGAIAEGILWHRDKRCLVRSEVRAVAPAAFSSTWYNTGMQRVCNGPHAAAWVIKTGEVADEVFPAIRFEELNQFIETRYLPAVIQASINLTAPGEETDWCLEMIAPPRSWTLAKAAEELRGLEDGTWPIDKILGPLAQQDDYRPLRPSCGPLHGPVDMYSVRLMEVQAAVCAMELLTQRCRSVLAERQAAHSEDAASEARERMRASTSWDLFLANEASQGNVSNWIMVRWLQWRNRSFGSQDACEEHSKRMKAHALLLLEARSTGTWPIDVSHTEGEQENTVALT